MDGPRDPGTLRGHRRPVQEVLQGDLPGSRGPGCPRTRPGHKATAKQGHGLTSLHIPRGPLAPGPRDPEAAVLISEFQEKHRKRLLAFYGEKIARLEESLRKAMLRVEQLQSMRPSQHTAFGALRSPVSTPSAEPRGQLFRPPGSSASSERVEPMEVDLTPSPLRRPEPAGPTRVSLISPPQDGRMGSVSHLGPQQLSLTPSRTSGSQALRIPPVLMPGRGSSQSLGLQAAGRAGGGGSAPAPRPPISISGLLQRQQSGSASLGGFPPRR
ncbi:probable E3 SUMO-protein ligase RNF212 isoform X3 [Eptesicus fuscus]|uniref:probable E3 SUMO-protein ligase RNF212 isoform X3 n=1 Tax=Eptesicus fuscus TaxID=29078 RepID=UPI00240448B2|nr:probable E3 SUMO-protein ligase RNF212 isoform X3 [Eptesicus fuscus]